MNRTKLIQRRMCQCDEAEIRAFGNALIRTLRIRTTNCHTLHLDEILAREANE